MASVLRRLVYWSQKVSDFKPFIAKEKRVALQNRSSFYHGWFSRSGQELLEETMLCVSMVTFHRYLNVLVGWRWIQTRSYLENQGGRSHYRANLKNLCIDLQKNGHSLPDFSLYEVLSSSEQENSENSKRPNINTNFASEVENRFLKRRNT